MICVRTAIPIKTFPIRINTICELMIDSKYNDKLSVSLCKKTFHIAIDQLEFCKDMLHLTG